MTAAIVLAIMEYKMCGGIALFFVLYLLFLLMFWYIICNFLYTSEVSVFLSFSLFFGTVVDILCFVVGKYFVTWR